MDAVSGRTEDTITLAGARVYPNVFHAALDQLDLGGWQVIAVEHGIDVRVVRGSAPIVTGDLAARLRAELQRAGVTAAAVSVHEVDDIPRTALGKQPLITHAQ